MLFLPIGIYMDFFKVRAMGLCHTPDSLIALALKFRLSRPEGSLAQLAWPKVIC